MTVDEECGVMWPGLDRDILGDSGRGVWGYVGQV